MNNRTINNKLLGPLQHQFRNPIEKKKRDLAELIAATFPGINVDISPSIFHHPKDFSKVNQLLDHILRTFSTAGLLTLPSYTSSRKQDIFRAISMLMANFMSVIPPMQELPMSILIDTDLTVESNFNKIHELFTYMCKIKIKYDRFKKQIKDFQRFNHTNVLHLKDVSERLPAQMAEVMKLNENKARTTTQLTMVQAEVEETEKLIKIKTEKSSKFTKVNRELVQDAVHQLKHSI